MAWADTRDTEREVKRDTTSSEHSRRPWLTEVSTYPIEHVFAPVPHAPPPFHAPISALRPTQSIAFDMTRRVAPVAHAPFASCTQPAALNPCQLVVLGSCWLVPCARGT